MPSRTQAQAEIDAGRVLVGGSVADKAARLVGADEAVVLRGDGPRFVSRGGEKLDAALGAWAIDVTGRRVLDAGASTGGFTDCVLQRGAREVVAVDVGHGQLAWKLREDPRVVVLERTNIRNLTELPGGPADIVVGDLSFISLRTVAPALVAIATPAADFVLLVKPQFEAGRERVGRGGIVRDPLVHRAVLSEVVDGLAAHGLTVTAVIRSPLTGADGNVEFLAHARPAATGVRTVAREALDALTAVAA